MGTKTLSVATKRKLFKDLREHGYPRISRVNPWSDSIYEVSKGSKMTPSDYKKIKNICSKYSKEIKVRDRGFNICATIELPFIDS